MNQIAPDRSLDKTRLPSISKIPNRGSVDESVVVKTQPKKKVAAAGAPPSNPPRPPKGPTGGGGKDKDKWDNYLSKGTKDSKNKQFPPSGKGKY